MHKALPRQTLTHVAQPPLGEGDDAAANPEELLNHAGQRGLLLLTESPLFGSLIVLYQEEGAFHRRAWFVSGGGGGRTHQN